MNAEQENMANVEYQDLDLQVKVDEIELGAKAILAATRPNWREEDIKIEVNILCYPGIQIISLLNYFHLGLASQFELAIEARPTAKENTR